MKHLTKEELIEQLKALANDETEVPMSMGAMCYSPAPPEPVKAKCDSCGKQIQEMSWRKVDRHILNKKIKTIENLGFDAKIEQLCSDCVAKLGLKDENGDAFYDGEMYYVFYFKTKEQENYHLAVSNDEDDYNAVIAFLKNEKTYTDYFDNTHIIKEELPLIQRMTGISI